MRVLILSGNYKPIPGGQSEQAALLAETFLEAGCSVEVISERQHDDLPRREVINGVQVHRLRQPSRAGTKKLFRRNLAGLMLLALRLSIRMIWRRSRFDLCIVRTVSSHAFVTGFLRAYNLVRFKTIITAETGGERDEISYLSSMAFKEIIIRYIKRNDFFNCNNEENYNHYLKLGFPTDRITKIYNGVDTGVYPNSHYPARIVNFSFLAELNREKGVRELLDAFVLVHDQYPHVKLFIGGYGDEETYIKAFIRDKRLTDIVYFLGYVNENEKEGFFRKGDCFVFPSYSEGFGLVVAEAVTYKRVVITTKVADLYDLLGDKVFYCEKRNILDLAEKMKSVVESYAIDRINYDSIIPNLSIKRTAREFVELYYKD